MSKSDGGLMPNNRPQFLPAGFAGRKGVQSRYSFIGADGKRHWHPEVRNLGPHKEASLRETSLKSIMRGST